MNIQKQQTTCTKIIGILIILISFQIRANTNIATKDLESYMPDKSNMGFMENKGQFKDMAGNPVNEVLFKTYLPGLDIYVTTKGLKYVFIKMDTDEEESNEREEDEPEICSSYEYKVVDLILNGARITGSNIEKLEPSDYSYNFLGGNLKNEAYGIKKYNKIIIREVYPGIDWVLYKTASDFHGKDYYLKNYQNSQVIVKHEFIVHPGADYRLINWLYKGSKPLVKGEKGEIVIKTDIGNLVEQSPYSYLADSKEEVNLSYGVNYTYNASDNDAVINLQSDRKLKVFEEDLIVDPYQLVWGTYCGGTGNGNEMPRSITTDKKGNVYVSGWTWSADFPTEDPGGGAYYDGFKPVNTDYDGFILKFTNAGVLLWGTYINGIGFGPEVINALVIDSNDNLFAVGQTRSKGMPVIDPGGGAYYQDTTRSWVVGTTVVRQEGYIAKFDSNSVLLWGTYMGGYNDVNLTSVAVNSQNKVIVVGTTNANDLPATDFGGGAYYDASWNGQDDGVMMQFSNNGVLEWLTYFGGGAQDVFNDVLVDQNDNIHVCGNTYSINYPLQNLAGGYNQPSNAGQQDGIITSFNPNLTLRWSTYVGGSSWDYFYDNAVDGNNNTYVTGLSQGNNFPTQNPGNGAYYEPYDTLSDGILIQFDENGSMLWGTYIAGNSRDNIFGVTASNCMVAISGSTSSTNLNVKSAGTNSFYKDHYSGEGNTFFGDDLFFMAFSLSGQQLWGTYWGGKKTDDLIEISFDLNNNLFYTMDAGGLTYADSILYTYTDDHILDMGSGAYFQPHPGSFNDKVNVGKFLNEPKNFFLAINIDSVSCVGKNNGRIEIDLVDSALFSWTPGGSTESFIENISAGTYTCNITALGQCARDTTIIFTLAFDSTQQPILQTITIDTIKCYGTANGRIEISSLDSASFLWSPGGSTDSFIENLASGTYTCTISSLTGCSTDTVISIELNSPDELVSQVSTIINANCQENTGGSVSLITNGGVPPYLYSWQHTNDTSSGAGSLTPGDYTVYIYDNHNCSDTLIFTITSDNNTLAFIANSFTPDGDGKNDYFSVGNICEKTIEMNIYNKFGTLLFSETGLQPAWDGRYNEILQEAGVYVYRIRIMDNNNLESQNHPANYTGNILLID